MAIAVFASLTKAGVDARRSASSLNRSAGS